MSRMCKNPDYTYIEVIDSVWYNPFPRIANGELPITLCIGIVKVLDTKINNVYCRIGYGSGINQQVDEDNIVAGGVKIDGGIFVK